MKLNLSKEWCMKMAEQEVGDPTTGKPSIIVTENDIGRHVTYRARHGATEVGRITSFNEHYVFVNFGRGSTSAACSYESLEYENVTRTTGV